MAFSICATINEFEPLLESTRRFKIVQYDADDADFGRCWLLVQHKVLAAKVMEILG